MTVPSTTRLSAASEPAEASGQNAAAFVRGLLSLRRAIGLYPPGHPAITEKVTELHGLIGPELVLAPDLQLDFVDNVLLCGGAPVQQDAAAAQALRDLMDIGIHSIRLRAGVLPEELLAVAQFLWDYEDQPSEDPVGARLARRGVQHISLARIVPLDTRWYAREWPDAPTGQLDPDYEQALAMAQHAFDDVAAGRDLDRVTVRDLVQLLIHRVACSNAALGQILAMKQYENLTYAHSVNVSMVSLLIGRRIGLDEGTTTALVEGALLHDIGKTRIPLDILRKPGALTPHERKQIELHSTYGAEILVGLEGLAPLTPRVALEHHRTVRGSGYPELGDGRLPHTMSQIVSVADIYEAITGARTYREPTPPERACLILARISGEQLNPAYVKAFVNTITFFPVGSFVRTSLGELAVVARTNPDEPLHPVIAVLTPTLDGISSLVDTSHRDGGGYERHVVETVQPPEGAPGLTDILTSAVQAALPS